MDLFLRLINHVSFKFLLLSQNVELNVDFPEPLRGVNHTVFPSSGASPTCVNTAAAALRRGARSPATALDQDTPEPPVTTVSTYSTSVLQQVPDLHLL